MGLFQQAARSRIGINDASPDPILIGLRYDRYVGYRYCPQSAIAYDHIIFVGSGLAGDVVFKLLNGKFLLRDN